MKRVISDEQALWDRFTSRRAVRCVEEAYRGDIRRALADSDDAVSKTVAAWKRTHGITPRDLYI